MDAQYINVLYLVESTVSNIKVVPVLFIFVSIPKTGEIQTNMNMVQYIKIYMNKNNFIYWEYIIINKYLNAPVNKTDIKYSSN